jgi:hypothetical protein
VKDLKDVHFVFCDDGSYSGQQLISNYILLNTITNSLGISKNSIFDIIVPFTTRVAHYNLLSYATSHKNNLPILWHLPNMIETIYEELQKRFGDGKDDANETLLHVLDSTDLPAIYFNFKIPDSSSTYTSLIQGGAYSLTDSVSSCEEKTRGVIDKNFLKNCRQDNSCPIPLYKGRFDDCKK